MSVNMNFRSSFSAESNEDNDSDDMSQTEIDELLNEETQEQFSKQIDELLDSTAGADIGHAITEEHTRKLRQASNALANLFHQRMLMVDKDIKSSGIAPISAVLSNPDAASSVNMGNKASTLLTLMLQKKAANLKKQADMFEQKARSVTMQWSADRAKFNEEMEKKKQELHDLQTRLSVMERKARHKEQIGRDRNMVKGAKSEEEEELSEIMKLKDQIEKLEEELGTKRHQVSELSVELSDTKMELMNAGSKIDILSRRVEDLVRTDDKLSDQLEALEHENAEKTKRLNRIQDQFDEAQFFLNTEKHKVADVKRMLKEKETELDKTSQTLKDNIHDLQGIVKNLMLEKEEAAKNSDANNRKMKRQIEVLTLDKEQSTREKKHLVTALQQTSQMMESVLKNMNTHEASAEKKLEKQRERTDEIKVEIKMLAANISKVVKGAQARVSDSENALKKLKTKAGVIGSFAAAANHASVSNSNGSVSNNGAVPAGETTATATTSYSVLDPFSPHTQHSEALVAEMRKNDDIKKTYADAAANYAARAANLQGVDGAPRDHAWSSASGSVANAVAAAAAAGGQAAADAVVSAVSSVADVASSNNMQAVRSMANFARDVAAAGSAALSDGGGFGSNQVKSGKQETDKRMVSPAIAQEVKNSLSNAPEIIGSSTSTLKIPTTRFASDGTKLQENPKLGPRGGVTEGDSDPAVKKESSVRHQLQRVNTVTIGAEEATNSTYHELEEEIRELRKELEAKDVVNFPRRTAKEGDTEEEKELLELNDDMRVHLENKHGEIVELRALLAEESLKMREMEKKIEKLEAENSSLEDSMAQMQDEHAEHSELLKMNVQALEELKKAQEYLQKEKKRLQGEVSEFSTTSTARETSLRSVQSTLDKLQAQVKTLEEKNQNLSKELDEKTLENEELQDQLQDNQEKVADLEEKLDQAKRRKRRGGLSTSRALVPSAKNSEKSLGGSRNGLTEDPSSDENGGAAKVQRTSFAGLANSETGTSFDGVGTNEGRADVRSALGRVRRRSSNLSRFGSAGSIDMDDMEGMPTGPSRRDSFAQTFDMEENEDFPEDIPLPRVEAILRESIVTDNFFFSEETGEFSNSYPIDEGFMTDLVRVFYFMGKDMIQVVKKARDSTNSRMQSDIFLSNMQGDLEGYLLKSAKELLINLEKSKEEALEKAKDEHEDAMAEKVSSLVMRKAEEKKAAMYEQARRYNTEVEKWQEQYRKTADKLVQLKKDIESGTVAVSSLQMEELPKVIEKIEPEIPVESSSSSNGMTLIWDTLTPDQKFEVRWMLREELKAEIRQEEEDRISREAKFAAAEQAKELDPEYKKYAEAPLNLEEMKKELTAGSLLHIGEMRVENFDRLKNKHFGTDELISLTAIEHHLRYDEPQIAVEEHITSGSAEDRAAERSKKRRQYRMQVQALKIQRDLVQQKVLEESSVLDLLRYKHATEQQGLLLKTLSAWRSIKYYENGGPFQDVLQMHLEVIERCIELAGGWHKALVDVELMTDLRIKTDEYPEHFRVRMLEIIRQKLLSDVEEKQRTLKATKRTIQAANSVGYMQRHTKLPFDESLTTEANMQRWTEMTQAAVLKLAGKSGKKIKRSLLSESVSGSEDNSVQSSVAETSLYMNDSLDGESLDAPSQDEEQGESENDSGEEEGEWGESDSLVPSKKKKRRKKPKHFTAETRASKMNQTSKKYPAMSIQRNKKTDVVREARIKQQMRAKAIANTRVTPAVPKMGGKKPVVPKDVEEKLKLLAEPRGSLWKQGQEEEDLGEEMSDLEGMSAAADKQPSRVDTPPRTASKEQKKKSTSQVKTPVSTEKAAKTKEASVADRTDSPSKSQSNRKATIGLNSADLVAGKKVTGLQASSAVASDAIAAAFGMETAVMEGEVEVKPEKGDEEMDLKKQYQDLQPYVKSRVGTAEGPPGRVMSVLGDPEVELINTTVKAIAIIRRSLHSKGDELVVKALNGDSESLKVMRSLAEAIRYWQKNHNIAAHSMFSNALGFNVSPALINDLMKLSENGFLPPEVDEVKLKFENVLNFCVGTNLVLAGPPSEKDEFSMSVAKHVASTVSALNYSKAKQASASAVPRSGSLEDDLKSAKMTEIAAAALASLAVAANTPHLSPMNSSSHLDVGTPSGRRSRPSSFSNMSMDDYDPDRILSGNVSQTGLSIPSSVVPFVPPSSMFVPKKPAMFDNSTQTAPINLSAATPPPSSAQVLGPFGGMRRGTVSSLNMMGNSKRSITPVSRETSRRGTVSGPSLNNLKHFAVSSRMLSNLSANVSARWSNGSIPVEDDEDSDSSLGSHGGSGPPTPFLAAPAPVPRTQVPAIALAEVKPSSSPSQSAIAPMGGGFPLSDGAAVDALGLDRPLPDGFTCAYYDEEEFEVQPGVRLASVFRITHASILVPATDEELDDDPWIALLQKRQALQKASEEGRSKEPELEKKRHFPDVSALHEWVLDTNIRYCVREPGVELNKRLRPAPSYLGAPEIPGCEAILFPVVFPLKQGVNLITGEKCSWGTNFALPEDVIMLQVAESATPLLELLPRGLTPVQLSPIIKLSMVLEKDIALGNVLPAGHQLVQIVNSAAITLPSGIEIAPGVKFAVTPPDMSLPHNVRMIKKTRKTPLPDFIIPITGVENEEENVIVNLRMNQCCTVVQKPEGVEFSLGMELIRRPQGQPLPTGMSLVPFSAYPAGLADEMDETMELVQLVPRFDYPPDCRMSHHWCILPRPWGMRLPPGVQLMYPDRSLDPMMSEHELPPLPPYVTPVAMPDLPYGANLPAGTQAVEFLYTAMSGYALPEGAILGPGITVMNPDFFVPASSEAKFSSTKVSSLRRSVQPPLNLLLVHRLPGYPLPELVQRGSREFLPQGVQLEEHMEVVSISVRFELPAGVKIDPGVVLGPYTQFAPGTELRTSSGGTTNARSYANSLEVVVWPHGVFLPPGTELVKRPPAGQFLPFGFEELSFQKANPYARALPAASMLVSLPRNLYLPTTLEIAEKVGLGIESMIGHSSVTLPPGVIFASRSSKKDQWPAGMTPLPKSALHPKILQLIDKYQNPAESRSTKSKKGSMLKGSINIEVVKLTPYYSFPPGTELLNGVTVLPKPFWLNTPSFVELVKVSKRYRNNLILGKGVARVPMRPEYIQVPKIQTKTTRVSMSEGATDKIEDDYDQQEHKLLTLEEQVVLTRMNLPPGSELVMITSAFQQVHNWGPYLQGVQPVSPDVLEPSSLTLLHSAPPVLPEGHFLIDRPLTNDNEALPAGFGLGLSDEHQRWKLPQLPPKVEIMHIIPSFHLPIGVNIVNTSVLRKNTFTSSGVQVVDGKKQHKKFELNNIPQLGLGEHVAAGCTAVQLPHYSPELNHLLETDPYLRKDAHAFVRLHNYKSFELPINLSYHISSAKIVEEVFHSQSASFESIRASFLMNTPIGKKGSTDSDPGPSLLENSLNRRSNLSISDIIKVVRLSHGFPDPRGRFKRPPTLSRILNPNADVVEGNSLEAPDGANGSVSARVRDIAKRFRQKAMRKTRSEMTPVSTFGSGLVKLNDPSRDSFDLRRSRTPSVEAPGYSSDTVIEKPAALDTVQSTRRIGTAALMNVDPDALIVHPRLVKVRKLEPAKKKEVQVSEFLSRLTVFRMAGGGKYDVGKKGSNGQLQRKNSMAFNILDASLWKLQDTVDVLTEERNKLQRQLDNAMQSKADMQDKVKGLMQELDEIDRQHHYHDDLKAIINKLQTRLGEKVIELSELKGNKQDNRERLQAQVEILTAQLVSWKDKAENLAEEARRLNSALEESSGSPPPSSKFVRSMVVAGKVVKEEVEVKAELNPEFQQKMKVGLDGLSRVYAESMLKLVGNFEKVLFSSEALGEEATGDSQAQKRGSGVAMDDEEEVEIVAGMVMKKHAKPAVGSSPPTTPQGTGGKRVDGVEDTALSTAASIVAKARPDQTSLISFQNSIPAYFPKDLSRFADGKPASVTSGFPLDLKSLYKFDFQTLSERDHPAVIPPLTDLMTALAEAEEVQAGSSRPLSVSSLANKLLSPLPDAGEGQSKGSKLRAKIRQIRRDTGQGLKPVGPNELHLSRSLTELISKRKRNPDGRLPKLPDEFTSLSISGDSEVPYDWASVTAAAAAAVTNEKFGLDDFVGTMKNQIEQQTQNAVALAKKEIEAAMVKMTAEVALSAGESKGEEKQVELFSGLVSQLNGISQNVVSLLTHFVEVEREQYHKAFHCMEIENQLLHKSKKALSSRCEFLECLRAEAKVKETDYGRINNDALQDKIWHLESKLDMMEEKLVQPETQILVNKVKNLENMKNLEKQLKFLSMSLRQRADQEEAKIKVFESQVKRTDEGLPVGGFARMEKKPMSPLGAFAEGGDTSPKRFGGGMGELSPKKFGGGIGRPVVSPFSPSRPRMPHVTHQERKAIRHFVQALRKRAKNYRERADTIRQELGDYTTDIIHHVETYQRCAQHIIPEHLLVKVLQWGIRCEQEVRAGEEKPTDQPTEDDSDSSDSDTENDEKSSGAKQAAPVKQITADILTISEDQENDEEEEEEEEKEEKEKEAEEKGIDAKTPVEDPKALNSMSEDSVSLGSLTIGDSIVGGGLIGGGSVVSGVSGHSGLSSGSLASQSTRGSRSQQLLSQAGRSLNQPAVKHGAVGSMPQAPARSHLVVRKNEQKPVLGDRRSKR